MWEKFIDYMLEYKYKLSIHYGSFNWDYFIFNHPTASALAYHISNGMFKTCHFVSKYAFLNIAFYNKTFVLL